MAETQETRVLDVLGDNRWHCGNEFLERYIPRYSAVIWTLRKQRGYDIEGVPCDLHRTKGHSPFMFRIRAYPAHMVARQQTSWL